jgi:hypothetical protein
VIALGLLFALGLLLRLSQLARLPEIHYDEAVNGLMARHVLQGEFPIFYWGQDYAGTLGAYLVSVPFAVFDSSPTTLRLVPLGLSLLLIPVSYRLARAAYDAPTARVAVLYAALPPLALLHMGVSAKDPYPEIPILGALCLLLALRLVREDRPDGARAFVLGLIGGLAWWSQPLLVSYLLGAGVLLLARRPADRLRREGGLALVGFVVGSLPFWVYNVGRPATFGLVRGTRLAEIWGSLGDILRSDLPFTLGASGPWAAPVANQAVGVVMAVVYLPAAALLLYETGRVLWTPRALGPPALLSLTAVAVIVVDAASGYRSVGGFKYLFPLYGILPALLAHYTVAVRRAVGFVPGLLVGLAILGLHAQDSLRDWLDSRQPGHLEAQARPPTGGLIAFLRDHGLSHVYAHFRISLKLTFDSREAIVASDWYGFRSAEYLDAVERAPAVALVAHRTLKLPDPATLEENLRALGGTFQTQEVDGFVVFYDFHPPPPSHPIPATGWSGRGRPRTEGADRAYDRDAATWWGSGEAQRPGLAYELDLGRPHRLTGLALHPGPVLDGAPRGYRVEVSADGRRWTEVVRVAETLPGLHWRGAQPRLDQSGRLRASFPAVEARQLRLTETGHDAFFWWSIGEIFLDEEGGGGRPSPGRPALEAGERLERRAGWQFVGASPVARDLWHFRAGVDWDAILAAYTRATRADPELEEAHHRLAVVLARLGIPPPGDPGRAAAFARIGAWRTAAEEYETAGRDTGDGFARSSPWEGRLRVARSAGETTQARELEGRLRAQFTPPIPSGVTFGRRLRFLGLALEPARVAPGQRLRLRAYWEALAPLDGAYEVGFVFKGAERRFDSGGRPLGDAVARVQWLAGERVREEFVIDVPPDALPARYEIRLSVRPVGARRALRVWRFGLPTPSREAVVAVLDVVPR